MLSNIPPPDRKQFLTVKLQKDWRNPFLMLNSDGTITLLVADAENKTIQSTELEKQLTELSPTQWPFGRVIAVQPCALRSSLPEDFAREDKAIKETWSRMRDTMNRLEVQFNLWPSA